MNKNALLGTITMENSFKNPAEKEFGNVQTAKNSDAFIISDARKKQAIEELIIHRVLVNEHLIE